LSSELNWRKFIHSGSSFPVVLLSPKLCDSFFHSQGACLRLLPKSKYNFMISPVRKHSLRLVSFFSEHPEGVCHPPPSFHFPENCSECNVSYLKFYISPSPLGVCPIPFVAREKPGVGVPFLSLFSSLTIRAVFPLCRSISTCLYRVPLRYSHVGRSNVLFFLDPVRTRSVFISHSPGKF